MLQRVGEAARGHAPDELAAMIDTLMRHCACALALDPERRQPPGDSTRLLADQSIATDEVALVKRDEALKAALPGGELRIHVAIHGAEGFFEAQRLERIKSEEAQCTP